MIIHNPILTGSFTVNGTDVASITSSAASITALNSYTASQNILNGTYTLTSSFAAQTASFTAFTSSVNAFSASILAQTASLNSFSASVLTFTGSASTRLGALEAATASLYTATSSLNASVASLNSYTQSTDAKIASIYSTTSSLNTRVGTLEAYTSSLNDKTSSFATTGSNTFIGTQTITGSVLQSGSFTSTGTLTAQTLVVQTITSSVVYSSGSNIFGNAIGNTQTFTGSVLVTGSLTISTGGNVSAPTIFGSTIACSPIGCFATSCATSFIGGTMSGTTIYGSTAVCSPVGLFSGCVGIGTSSPIAAAGTALAIYGGASQARLALKNSATGDGSDDGLQIGVGTDGGSFLEQRENNYMILSTNATERMRITSTGIATFACQVCAPSFIGGTMSGTTIYGSTAVCSAVGKFTTCLDLGGALTGTSAIFSSTITGTTIYGSTMVCAASLKAQSGFADLVICGSNTTSPHIGGTFVITTNQDALGRTIIGNSAVGRAMYLEAGGTFTFLCAATFNSTVTAAGLLTVNGFGTNTFCSGGTGYNKLVLRNTTAGVANGAQLSVGTDADADQLYILSFATTYTTSGMNIAGGAVINGEGPGGLSVAATQSNIGFYTNGAAAGNLRMTIASTGTVTFACDIEFGSMRIFNGNAVGTKTITTSAVTLQATSQYGGGNTGNLSLVSGIIQGNGGIGFVDVVLWMYGGSTPTVISSQTTGSPAGRTYSISASANLQLAMASGTYFVSSNTFRQSYTN